MQTREAYAENCGRCHGADGRGSDELEGELARIMPDFTDPKWRSSRSDEELFEVILKGGAAVGKNQAMPPWEGVLNEGQIKSTIEYIRAFGQAAK